MLDLFVHFSKTFSVRKVSGFRRESGPAHNPFGRILTHRAQHVKLTLIKIYRIKPGNLLLNDVIFTLVSPMRTQLRPLHVAMIRFFLTTVSPHKNGIRRQSIRLGNNLNLAPCALIPPTVVLLSSAIKEA